MKWLKWLLLFLCSPAPVCAVTVSGGIQSPAGAPVAGVSVSIEQVGGELPLLHGTSGADGRWAVTHPFLFGTLRMTPSSTAYAFAPAQRDVFTDNNLAGQNFTATSLGDIEVRGDRAGEVLAMSQAITRRAREGDAPPGFPLILRNTGTGPLINIAARLTGAQQGLFRISTPPPVTLAAGAQATMLVEGPGAAQGIYSAQVEITSSDTDESIVQGMITAQMLPPFVASLHPGALGGSRVEWFGEEAVFYQIETSGDMISWQPFGPLLRGADAPLAAGFEQPAARQFYRVNIVPPPPVTAVFNPSLQSLTVTGTPFPERIVISAAPDGTLRLNDGAGLITGGTPTTANTQSVTIRAGAGNDIVQFLHAPARAFVFGEEGDDTLNGTPGSDVLDGGPGNDVLSGLGSFDDLFGGSGDDIIRWNPGDGSDRVEGGAGADRLEINGASLQESFTIAPAGTRARLLRDVAGVSQDCADVETFHLAPGGGQDAVSIKDMTGTDLALVTLLPGDGIADLIVVEGTSAADSVGLTGDATRALVSGLSPQVEILSPDPADRLSFVLMNGADTLQAAGYGGPVPLTVDGGPGNDQLAGSPGDDTFTWAPGDGSDTIEGLNGRDTLSITGSAVAEHFTIAPSSGRVLVSRNVAAVTLNADGLEVLSLQPGAGSDVIGIADMSGTALLEVSLALQDGSVDTVTMDGTAGADVLALSGSPGLFSATGLSVPLGVSSLDGAFDTFTANLLGDDDVAEASGVSALSLSLVLGGGGGDDVLIGGNGNDRLLGGPGDDVLSGGPGTDVLDGGPGSNVLQP